MGAKRGLFGEVAAAPLLVAAAIIRERALLPAMGLRNPEGPETPFETLSLEDRLGRPAGEELSS